MTIATPSTRPQKLAIIHLLGWMVGVGAVLAIDRLGAPLNGSQGQHQLHDQLIHLGFGLTYGTAISGLALFLWRWRSGSGPAPSQPGHWLLIFGGLGLVIDKGVALVVLLGPILLHLPRRSFGDWAIHQLACWNIAALIVLVSAFHMLAACPWHVFVWTALAFFLANAAFVGVRILAAYGVVQGNWPTELGIASRLIGQSCCVLALAAAEGIDRWQRRSRDWLHAVGICAALSLASLDIASTPTAPGCCGDKLSSFAPPN